MFTPFTRQYQENKNGWFEVWPVVAVTEDKISVMRADERIAREDIAGYDDTVVEVGGFIVMSHNTRRLHYITAEEAQNYIKPVR